MRKSAPLLVFLVAVFTAHLSAQSAPGNCEAGLLSTYDATGFSCQLGQDTGGILLFNNFFFSPGTSSYTDSEIEVTPVPEGEGGGFSFNLASLEPFSAPSDQIVDFGIDYDYRINIDPFVAGANLGMDPIVGNVVITETLCVDPFAGQGCASRPSFSVDNTNPEASWTNGVTFDPPAAFGANVVLDFLLTGGDGAISTFDKLTSTNVVSDSPEPFSACLALGGLAAIALRRRYRRNA